MSKFEEALASAFRLRNSIVAELLHYIDGDYNDPATLAGAAKFASEAGK